MKASQARFLPLLLASILLASCSAKDKGSEACCGAYSEPEPTGGAYGVAVMAEEMPSLAQPAVAGSLSALSAPSAPSTENYPAAAPNPVKSVADEPVSTFSIDVDTASYANVRRFIQQGTIPPRDAVRTEELVNYFDYGYARPTSTKKPFEPTISVVPCPWKSGNLLLQVGLQGYDIDPKERPALNLVLLIDVSGSMESEDRLPLVQKALHMLVAELTPNDRVSIVVYAGSSGVVLDSASGGDQKKILDAIDHLSAGGSTAGGQGIEEAYRLAAKNFRKRAVNRVILATDGDFNVGISDPGALEALIAKKREGGVYLSILGVGRGNYQDARMQKLAQAGNGNASYLDSLVEARKVLHDEMRAALLPIADDVKIQVEFNPARVAEYRLIGYETRLLRREDFSNDRVDAGEIGAGASVTALYELVPTGGKTTVEPLRYQKPDGKRSTDSEMKDELAFLRIRYKAPGTKTSILFERPITDRDSFASIDKAPEATRFATAVAAYGQLLRGDPYLDSNWGWTQVIELANGAKGQDEYGWRAEFVQLSRQAQILTPVAHP